MKRRLVQEFYRFLQLLTTSYKFFHWHFEQCIAAPFDSIEEVVDEGVAADDLNPEAPDQGVFASHLAQGGHHAHEIMPEFVEVPSLRCMGESRVAELKRRAEPFSRSTCETFSFCTSKTLSFYSSSMARSFEPWAFLTCQMIEVISMPVLLEKQLWRICKNLQEFARIFKNF